jgi:hypothetical protein
MRILILLASLALAAPAFAQSNQVVQGMGTAGSPKGGVVTVQASDNTGSATFDANNVCASVLTAGTLAATLTPYYTGATSAVNCATAGTCTTAAFSSGATIVTTNPNGTYDVGITVVGGVRQVEVCTTSYTSGSAAGNVTATFVQAASSGGGTVTANQGSPPWLDQLTPNGITTTETLYGSGTSPLACTAANTPLLSANARSTAFFQNVGTADVCLCLNATTCPAPGAGCQIVLTAATAANKGNGATFSIGGNSGKTWAGGVTCGGSAGGSVGVYAY